MAARENNTNALRHGGESAIDAIKNGTPLRGLAHEAELEVCEQFEKEGRYSLVLRNATRLQAACNLYWNAVQKAAEDQDLERLDRYIARFGWLAGASLRAWAHVAQEEKEQEPEWIDALEAATEARE